MISHNDQSFIPCLNSDHHIQINNPQYHEHIFAFTTANPSLTLPNTNTNTNINIIPGLPILSHDDQQQEMDLFNYHNNDIQNVQGHYEQVLPLHLNNNTQSMNSFSYDSSTTCGSSLGYQITQQYNDDHQNYFNNIEEAALNYVGDINNNPISINPYEVPCSFSTEEDKVLILHELDPVPITLSGFQPTASINCEMDYNMSSLCLSSSSPSSSMSILTALSRSTQSCSPQTPTFFQDHHGILTKLE